MLVPAARWRARITNGPGRPSGAALGSHCPCIDGLVGAGGVTDLGVAAGPSDPCGPSPQSRQRRERGSGLGARKEPKGATVAPACLAGCPGLGRLWPLATDLQSCPGAGAVDSRGGLPILHP